MAAGRLGACLDRRMTRPWPKPAAQAPGGRQSAHLAPSEPSSGLGPTKVCGCMKCSSAASTFSRTAVARGLQRAGRSCCWRAHGAPQKASQLGTLATWAIHHAAPSVPGWFVRCRRRPHTAEAGCSAELCLERVLPPPLPWAALGALTPVGHLAHGRVRVVLGSLGGLRSRGVAAGEHLRWAWVGHSMLEKTASGLGRWEQERL